MANNQTIKIGVEINSNSAKETTQAERLGAALKDAAATAQKIKIPAGGGATGVQQVMQKSVPVGAQAVMQYGQQRGTAGITGAEARDFARQSEGLGGLVRLYATYAANIYAVSAAFRALSQAMDTTNMVRGLNQIGASSGVALGALSKELANATGNAISLREAMSATVKVTSAGLGSESVLRLGQVAAKAQQALGVDMNDAISRLSRGITKLEPELLDELGIFTKIEPAVQKYALSVGKTAAQLTDFERRQAFANAVLEEGEKKFAAIKVDANPYNKLAASLANIAQDGLELVNKVLTPIVNLLSASPTTLVTILGGLGISLLSKVVPALREIGTGSRKGADEALAVLRETQVKAQAIRDQAAKVTQERLNAAIDSAVAKADKAEQKLKSLQSAAVSKTPEGVILTSQKAQIDPNDPSVKNAVAGAYIRARELATQGDKEGAKALRDLADATKQYGKDLNTLQQQQDQTKLSNDKIIASNDRVAQSLETKAWKNNLVEQAKFNASVGGIGTALTILRSEIDKNEQGLNRWEKATTLVRGSLGALTGTLDKVAGAIGKLFFYVGIAVTVFETLKSVLSMFSGNADKVNAFNDTVITANERIKNLDATITEINKKPFAEQLNTQSVLAKATAINELANSSQKLINTFAEQDRTTGPIFKTIDNLKGFFGLSTKADKFSEVLGKNLFAGLKNAGNSQEAKAAKLSIEKALSIEGIGFKSEDQIIAAVKNIANNSGKLEEVNAAFKKLGTELNISASRSKELESATEELDKAYNTFFNGLKSSDAFDVFAEKQKAAGIKLLSSLADPERALSDLIKTIKDPASAQLFDSETFNQLQNAKKGLEELNEEQARNAALINESRDAYVKALDAATKLEKQRKKGTSPSEQPSVDAGANIRTPPVSPDLTAARERLAAAQKTLANAEKVLDDSKANGVKSAQNFAIAAVSAFERGAAVTSAKIEAALSRGSTIVTDNLIGFLGDLPGAATLRAKNEQRLINSQAALYKATLDQINETRQNTLAVEKNNLIQTKREISGDPLLDPKAIEAMVAPLNERIKTITTLQDVIGKGPRATQQVIKKGTEEAKATLKTPGATTEQVAGAVENLKIFEQAQDFTARQAELYGKLNELAQKSLSLEDTKKIAALRDQEKIRQNIYNGQLRAAQNGLEELQTQESLSGFLTAQQRSKREQLQLESLGLQLSKEESQALNDILVQELAVKRLKEEQTKRGATASDRKDLADAETELARRRTDLNKRREENDSKIDQQRLKSLQDRQRAEKEVFDFDLKSSAEIGKIIAEQDQVKLDAAEAELNRLISIDILSKSTIINEKAKIDALKIQKQEKQALYELDIKSADLAFRKTQLTALGELGIDTTEISRRLEVESGQLELQRNLLLSKNASQLLNIEQAKILALEQENFNIKLGETKNIAESLAGAFGKVGETLGQAIVGLVEMRRNQELNNKSIVTYIGKLNSVDKKIADIEESGDTPSGELFKERAEAQNELNKATKKAQMDEVAGNLKVLGSVKTMFKEKTGAYKAISAAEKVMHITKMGMMAAELAANLSSTAQSVINSGIKIAGYVAEAGAAGIKAITGAYAAPFPVGFIAGTAMAAIIGALLGKAFSGGKSAPKNFVPTAEQRKETQGTAMSWDLKEAYGSEGKKIRTREGVFGDTSAKSESIAKSLDLLADNSVDGLQYDNKILRAFEKLNQSMEKLAISIYNVQGISAGSAFGTMEGTTSSGISWLFGKKTSTEILDSGLVLKGNFLELAKATGGVIQQFEEVKTTRTSGGLFGIGGGTRVRIDTSYLELDNKSQQAVNEAFAQGYNTILTLGVEAGFSSESIDNALSTVSVDELASLRGLTGQALKDELQAVFGAIFDDASMAVFDSLKDYRKFGEGMLETATRVINTNKSINQLLENTNTSGTQFAKLGFEATESIADLFGGVDKAVTAFQNFEDAILTDEQRMQKKRERLSRGLASVGLADLRTREDYNRKYQELVTSGQTNTETFRKLIELGQDFGDVVDEIDGKIKTAFDEVKQSRDNLKDILKGLRDFRDSLNKTIMTPGELYLKAKKDFEALAAKAAAGDYESARKIGEAGETFRAASSTMFASSDAYVADVRSITSVVDSLETKFAGELSDAERAMTIAEQQDERLKTIVQNTETTYKNIDTLLNTVKKAPGSMTYSAITSGYYTARGPDGGVARPNLTNLTNNGAPVDLSGSTIIQGLANRDLLFNGGPSLSSLSSLNTPAAAPAAAPIYAEPAPAAPAEDDYTWRTLTQGAATGTNYLQKDQFLFVHEGERIIPAADNRRLMQMMSQYSNGGNTDLYNEVCRLTKQVEVLTQTVADGAILNATATDRNTEQIATTIQSASDSTVYNQKLQSKVAVV
jgi:hypothetical protein